MRLGGLARLFLVLLLSTATPARAGGAEALLDATGQKQSLVDIIALEPQALALAGHNAQRAGDTLRLHLRSGREKVYRDTPACANDKADDPSPQCHQFKLLAHARDWGLYVVVKAYYEAAEYFLVDDTTGDEVVLRSFPLFSPSGMQVLVLNVEDDEAGHLAQIWRHAQNGFALDWSGKPYADERGWQDIEYSLVRWVSESRIAMKATLWFEAPPSQIEKAFELRLTDRGWTLR